MIENLPLWISILFIITFVIEICIFYYANNKPKRLSIIILLWAALHSYLAYTGFYQDTTAIPPRFVYVIIPTVLLIIYSLLPKQREAIIRNRNIHRSTFLHVIRLPMEIILLQLFIHSMIPELMTFEGRNYDILAGITAPIIGLLYWKKKIGKKTLLIWNYFGLLLILFIFFNAILSAELPIQQFAFDQPNRGINYFPFILLPAIIVPIVIWTHLVDIFKLQGES